MNAIRTRSGSDGPKFKVQSSKFKETSNGGRFVFLRTSNFELRAFTLVEMVIVLAIVLLLVTMVLPAASTMWRQRRVADAQNTISGLLMTARGRALQGGELDAHLETTLPGGEKLKLRTSGESGLFFYVDAGGVQRIVGIAQVEPDYDRQSPPRLNQCNRGTWSSVFNVLPGRSYALPAPMRVVPISVVKDDPAIPAKDRFSPEELANNDVYRTVENQAQRHRNFFTMIYDANGRLQIEGDVYIRDEDTDNAQNPGGDVTGLKVALWSQPVSSGYKLTDDQTVSLDYECRSQTVDTLVIDDTQTAISFPHVDGIMVYDDSEFAAAGQPEDKRKFVVNTGQPFYVHRTTGTVVRGPVGETVAQAP